MGVERVAGSCRSGRYGEQAEGGQDSGNGLDGFPFCSEGPAAPRVISTSAQLLSGISVAWLEAVPLLVRAGSELPRLKPLSKGGANLIMPQREVDRGLQEAQLVTGVVTLTGILEAKDLLMLQQRPDGVGEL